MVNITGKTIEITRGDRIGFYFSIKDYTFKIGDRIEFRVYEKKGLNKQPLINKVFIVDEETDKVNITLTGDDTKIGDINNKPIIYWYEIELNNDNTVIGYDEDGPKELILYPEGVE